MTKQITLKNLKYATKQQIFDQVARHLLTQMERSTRAKNGLCCMYIGVNGLRCAAGSLIADDEYADRMEDKSWVDLVDMDMVPKRNCRFIRELQKLHDKNPPNNWPQLLKSLAEKHKLKCNF